jgi:predicted RNase H-like HicB family nuclease
MEYEVDGYKVNLSWSDEDNSFVTEVPELSGCMSDGKTVEEALANTRVVINEWLQIAWEDYYGIGK